VPPDAFHVGRGDPLDDRLAARGDHRERAPFITGAALAADQSLDLHAADLVREPAAGLRGEVGELGHPQPGPGRLGELDQDLVVVRGQTERVQVPVELAHQHLRQPDVGAPRPLLLRGEPARFGMRRILGAGLGLHTT